MGLGAYPSTDKQFLGMLGMHGTLEGIRQCTKVIYFGDYVRFDDRTTNNLEKYCPNAKVILWLILIPTSLSKKMCQ